LQVPDINLALDEEIHQVDEQMQDIGDFAMQKRIIDPGIFNIRNFILYRTRKMY